MKLNYMLLHFGRILKILRNVDNFLQVLKPLKEAIVIVTLETLSSGSRYCQVSVSCMKNIITLTVTSLIQGTVMIVYAEVISHLSNQTNSPNFKTKRTSRTKFSERMDGKNISTLNHLSSCNYQS